MGAERQTNIHTNTHIFQKTISVNQAQIYSQSLAICGHAPGLKKTVKCHTYKYTILTISFAFQQYKVPYKLAGLNIPQFYSTIITTGNNEIIGKL